MLTWWILYGPLWVAEAAEVLPLLGVALLAVLAVGYVAFVVALFTVLPTLLEWRDRVKAWWRWLWLK